MQVQNTLQSIKSTLKPRQTEYNIVGLCTACQSFCTLLIEACEGWGVGLLGICNSQNARSRGGLFQPVLFSKRSGKGFWHFNASDTSIILHPPPPSPLHPLVHKSACLPDRHQTSSLYTDISYSSKFNVLSSLDAYHYLFVPSAKTSIMWDGITEQAEC